MREIVYPEMATGDIVIVTALGVVLCGVTVICPVAACPATGTRLTPLDGDKAKSGVNTLMLTVFEVSW